MREGEPLVDADRQDVPLEEEDLEGEKVVEGEGENFGDLLALGEPVAQVVELTEPQPDGEGVRVAFAVREGEPELVVEGDLERVTLGEDVAQTVEVFDKLWVEVAVFDGDKEEFVLMEGEAELSPLAVAHADTVEDALAVGQTEADGAAVCVLQADAVVLLDAARDPEGHPEEDADTVTLPEGRGEPLPVGVGGRDWEVEGEEVREEVSVAEAQTDCVAEAQGLAEGEAVPEVEMLEVGLGRGDAVTEGEPELRFEAVPLGETEKVRMLAEADCEPVGVTEAEGVRLEEADREGEAEVEPLRLTEGVPVPLPDREGLSDEELVRVSCTDRVREGEEEVDKEEDWLPVSVGLRDCEGEAQPLEVGLREEDKVAELHPDTDSVRAPVALTVLHLEPEGLPETVRDFAGEEEEDKEGEGVPLMQALEEGEPEGGGDFDSEAEAALVKVLTVVRDMEGEGVADGEIDGLLLTLGEAVPVKERSGERVEEGDEVGVTDTLGDFDATSVPLEAKEEEGSAVADPVTVTLDPALPVTPGELVRPPKIDAVGTTVEEGHFDPTVVADAHGDTVADPVPDRDAETQVDVLAVAILVALEVMLSVAARVEEWEPVAEGEVEAEGQPEAVRVRPPLAETLTLAEKLAVGVLEKLPKLADEEGEGRTVPEAQPLPLEEPLTEALRAALGQGEGLPLPAALAEARSDRVGEAEGVAQGEPAALLEGVAQGLLAEDRVRLTVGEGVLLCDEEDARVAVAAELGVAAAAVAEPAGAPVLRGVAEGETETVCEGDEPPDAVARGEPEPPPPARLPESAAVTEGEPLAEGHPVPLGLAAALDDPVTVARCEMEAQGEDVPEMEGKAEALFDTVAFPEALSHPLLLMEALPLALPLRCGEGEAEAEREAQEEALPLRVPQVVALGHRELVGLPLVDRLRLGEPVGLRLLDEETLTLLQGVKVGVRLPLPLRLGLCVKPTLPDGFSAEPEGVALVDLLRLGEPVPEGQPLLEAEKEGEEQPLGVAVCVALPHTEPLLDAVPQAVATREGDPLGLCVRPPLAVASPGDVVELNEALLQGLLEPLAEVQAVMEAEPVPEPLREGEGLAVALPPTEREREGEGVPVSLLLNRTEPVPLPPLLLLLAETVVVPHSEAVELAEGEPVTQALGVAQEEALRERVGETVAEADTQREPVAQAVPLPEALGDRVPLLQPETDRDRLGEGDEEGEPVA